MSHKGSPARRYDGPAVVSCDGVGTASFFQRILATLRWSG